MITILKKLQSFTKSKFVLLTLLMLLNLGAFSQRDTVRIVLNKDSVTISKTTAQKILKDLYKLDFLSQENTFLKRDTATYIKLVQLGDSIIGEKNNQIGLLYSEKRDQHIQDSLHKVIDKSYLNNIKWLKIERVGLGLLFIASLIFFSTKH